jgi:chaperonin cofactor prefoldin
MGCKHCEPNGECIYCYFGLLPDSSKSDIITQLRTALADITNERDQLSTELEAVKKENAKLRVNHYDIIVAHVCDNNRIIPYHNLFCSNCVPTDIMNMTVSDLVKQINEKYELNEELITTLADKDKRLAEAVGLVEELHHEEDCSYDHHGYCQEHLWFHLDEVCPDKRSKQFLTANQPCDSVDVGQVDGKDDGK